MHPFFNSINRVLVLLLSWAILTFSISALISSTTDASLLNCLILLTPMYFLCLIFVLPNYYVCRGLPLESTSWLMLLASHLLTLVVVVVMWIAVGEAYAGLLDTVLVNTNWDSLLGESLTINLAIVVLQFEIVVLLHYLFFAMEKTRNLEQDALRHKLLVSQAELNTLKATVHPHFLFNSLNTLANIALSSPEKAHRFCLLIAEFLRYSVAYSKKSTATLNEELEHIQNYLGIERERFGSRLQTNFEIDDAVQNIVIPALILFPIVENAIKHGIDSCLEGGTISIKARQNKSMLVIEVSNPVDELGRKLKGTGHGLSSVEQRLKTRYSGKAMLKTIREPGSFTVQFYLPADHNLELQEVKS
ncbi:MAG: hypothetical protein COA96_03120 [SAR86 cluster bacterium]|uniref:Signal transduction histidine kinase internal region domain-containing protein n=1 Tax=SAR86 cluster bacterium TaxID=2030880 RepID=A0A2A5B7P4_9GAMM|nr:MAG: hypothetical protein COA96_03120 [SAR86 cluster bacterium]